jgi:hypothetical protein
VLMKRGGRRRRWVGVVASVLTLTMTLLSLTLTLFMARPRGRVMVQVAACSGIAWMPVCRAVSCTLTYTLTERVATVALRPVLSLAVPLLTLTCTLTVLIGVIRRWRTR